MVTATCQVDWATVRADDDDATVTDVLAIYAAAIGTAGFARQVWSQVHANRTKLKVRIAGGWDGALEPENHRVYVTIVNHSRHDVLCRGSTSLSPASGGPGRSRRANVSSGLPEEIAARGSVTVAVPVSRFQGIRVQARSSPT